MELNMKPVIVCLLGVAAVVAYFTIPRSQATPTPLRVGHPKAGRVEKTDAEWRAILTPEAYSITRQQGTERAFTGATWDNHAEGRYDCVACGQHLFDSTTKYDSGTGWPSFWKPTDPDAVSLFQDGSGFGARTEVVCSRCDAHLGHVFDDGPKPTGQRYCMNSGAMRFVPSKSP